MSPPKTKNISEAKVCRDIIDRHEVLQTQVLSLIMEQVGSSLDKKDLQELKNSLRGTFNTQTQGLLTQVSKRFQTK